MLIPIQSDMLITSTRKYKVMTDDKMTKAIFAGDTATWRQEFATMRQCDNATIGMFNVQCSNVQIRHEHAIN